eukprot:COSAG01_NODE_7_length_54400_cov_1218.054935_26_plen_578_part_00
MVSKLALTLHLFFLKTFWVRLRQHCKKILNLGTSIAILCGLSLFLLEFGFHLNSANQSLFTQFYHTIFYYFIIEICIKISLLNTPLHYLKKNSTDLCIILPLISTYFWPQTHPFLLHSILLILILKRLNILISSFQNLKVKPASLFLLSFIFSIFFGSIMLSLPVSNQAAQSLPYLDALFTATSAICVTGLSVNVIQESFSTFGQSIIIILCQIGGLGIMSFSILLSLLLKRRISQISSQEFQHTYDTFNLKETYSAIKFIFKFTLLFEAIGSVILFFLFKNETWSWTQRAFYAIFHAISAFCNAGFSLFDRSLEQFQTQHGILLCISTLIIIGGLGFPVLFNIFNIKKQKKSWHFLKLQTKIALIATLILLIIGTIAIWLSEKQHALENSSLITQWVNAFFLSTSARTAGFNTIDFNLFYPSTLLIILVLMIIGASPGSTGGGIKTTNFAILIIAFWQSIKSTHRVEIGGRTLPYAAIIKIFSLLILYLLGIFIVFYSLLWTETQAPLALLFETVSAFGTVGFSMGITAELSKWGKLLIIIAMFIGRMGPLTVAYALSKPKEKPNYHYPEENLSVM